MRLIPLVLALFAVCCTSPTRTAKNLIRQNIEQQIEMPPEMVNYHSIEFGGQLDTVYATIVDAKRLEGYKMRSHSEVRGIMRSIGNHDAEEVDSLSAFYTDKEIMRYILEHFYLSDKPTPIFLRMKHIFRSDSDEFGKNATFDCNFYFDIGLTRVEFVEADLPKEL